MLRIFFKNKNYIPLAVLLTGILGCNENRPVEDVSDIVVETNIVRFEKELFDITSPDAFQKVETLKKKHSTFYDLFTKYVVRTADKNDSLSKVSLLNFVKDKDIQSVFKESQALYAEIPNVESQLNGAFKQYKKAFPDKVIPVMYTFISGFNYAVISADSLLGIGLDMYLGADCKYYPALGLPKYKTNKMRTEFIVSDAVKGWVQSEYPLDETKKDFLYHIIYNGKLLYFQDALLPELEDSIKIGYTADQIDWCKKSEASIWAFFIQQKILYSSNYMDYLKFINEGPTTNGFPKESPSLLGNWIGWQIVRKYMEENRDVSLAQLMQEPDAQKILTMSKYKPKK